MVFTSGATILFANFGGTVTEDSGTNPRRLPDPAGYMSLGHARTAVAAMVE